MIDAVDIGERIRVDFEDEAPVVVRILAEAISKADHLNDARLLRCIIFLSEKSIDKLKATIKAACLDPRDVMLWAEYIRVGGGEELRHVRDFSRPFADADKGIRKFKD